MIASLETEKKVLTEAGVREELFDLPEVLEVFDELRKKTATYNPFTGRISRVGDRWNVYPTTDGGMLFSTLEQEHWASPSDYPNESKRTYEYQILVSPEGLIIRKKIPFCI